MKIKTMIGQFLLFLSMAFYALALFAPLITVTISQQNDTQEVLQFRREYSVLPTLFSLEPPITYEHFSFSFSSLSDGQREEPEPTTLAVTTEWADGVQAIYYLLKLFIVIFYGVPLFIWVRYGQASQQQATSSISKLVRGVFLLAVLFIAFLTLYSPNIIFVDRSITEVQVLFEGIALTGVEWYIGISLLLSLSGWYLHQMDANVTPS